jgi:hypothetical protein
MRCATRFFAVLAAAAVVGSSTLASAASIVFTIDPELSNLGIAIGAGAPPNVTIITTAQSPGSDSTSLFGEIFADITGGNLTLLPGGIIGLNDQPVPQQPDINGVAGSAPAQIGLTLTLPPLASGPAAIRGATAEASSSTTPIVGGTFDASTVELSLLTAFADINLSGVFALADRADLGGNGGSNQDPNGLITNVGDVYKLEIPIYIEVLVPAGDDLPLDLTAVLSGHIVATGVLVPEPGTIAMLGVGLVGLVAVGRRRFRKA